MGSGQVDVVESSQWPHVEVDDDKHAVLRFRVTNGGRAGGQITGAVEALAREAGPRGLGHSHMLLLRNAHVGVFVKSPWRWHRSIDQ